MKTFDEFIVEARKYKVISYPSSVGGDVYDPLTGKKRHLPKGKAMAKRSSSSAGGK